MGITTVAAKGWALLPLPHFKYYVIMYKVCITTGGPSMRRVKTAFILFE